MTRSQLTDELYVPSPYGFHIEKNHVPKTRANLGCNILLALSTMNWPLVQKQSAPVILQVSRVKTLLQMVIRERQALDET